MGLDRRFRGVIPTQTSGSTPGDSPARALLTDWAEADSRSGYPLC